ncbi:hypothetical protein FHS16_003206 [Paenibacillus endophyticus]|uniref:MORN repeat-containing protein n=1 Tax=Paenibacillus endophyticus TaxID=1294268 RepID=A0A7W5GBP8_9BACL|nr:hypothetical protein [Paenibacillus endophyticus]MBB3153147.1 hypothetical protein [Paenibacillus endophyticus]
MKKTVMMLFSFALVFVLTAGGGAAKVEAGAKKEFLQISKYENYYGQLKDGKPHGKGTMSWYSTKSYSGDWVNGKRTGTGTYVNKYKEDSKDFVITYSGEWKNDIKVGNGSLNTKITNINGVVDYHKIQFGTFANDIFAAGYSVAHTKANPVYSYNYKDAKMNLQITGTNVNMKDAWKTGKFPLIQYKKGNVIKHYSVAFNENPSLIKSNKATLVYLKNLQSQINPHLVKFEALSKRVPLA